MSKKEHKKNSIFTLAAPFSPAGDQPAAIEMLSRERPGKSVLLGVTGSGKTFTLAHVIASQNKPVLILSPNKTLAAQLYEEFSLFFPENKVCYFVSYYDYYQPESYLPAQDIYIPKETKINSELDRLRIETTASLINRPDTIVIASVSAIYSLGDPQDFRELAFSINNNDAINRKKLIDKLVALQYKRNDVELVPGAFRVHGSSLTINLPYMRDYLRIELFGDKIERIEFIDRREHKVVGQTDTMLIFPAKHFVTPQEKKEAALAQMTRDLYKEAATIANPLYKERLMTRVKNDIDMLRETGYCSGIENYSRYFDGRSPGEAPYSLLDFFPKDFLLIIDESHIAIPQLHGMYKGDRSRKQSLIDFGFRLQASYDNRPLTFEELEHYFNDVIFVSATPGPYELGCSQTVAEQIVRPTGIVDPELFIVPREGQLEHLYDQIIQTAEKGYRTLVTVLTKKAAEDLAGYLEKKSIKVCYMHSEIKTPQRTEILHKLRLGIFDCLVGINLLREGLDLPEVALVAILDADIESFLRDTRSLIQTIGRAARNAESKVLLYADRITGSMQRAIEETTRRRELQENFNKAHNIVPQTVQREVTKSISKLQQDILDAQGSAKKKIVRKVPRSREEALVYLIDLEKEMQLAAENLDFEKAIAHRDTLLALKKKFSIT